MTRKKRSRDAGEGRRGGVTDQSPICKEYHTKGSFTRGSPGDPARQPAYFAHGKYIGLENGQIYAEEGYIKTYVPPPLTHKIHIHSKRTESRTRMHLLTRCAQYPSSPVFKEPPRSHWRMATGGGSPGDHVVHTNWPRPLFSTTRIPRTSTHSFAPPRARLRLRAFRVVIGRGAPHHVVLSVAGAPDPRAARCDFPSHADFHSLPLARCTPCALPFLRPSIWADYHGPPQLLLAASKPSFPHPPFVQPPLPLGAAARRRDRAFRRIWGRKTEPRGRAHCRAHCHARFAEVRSGGLRNETVPSRGAGRAMACAALEPPCRGMAWCRARGRGKF